jgi:hypothetical protein
MKTPRWFIGNRFVSHLRMAGAVTLLSAAAAMAFVAIQPSGPFLLGKADNKSAVNKSRQSLAALLKNKLAVPGPEQDAGPTAAAEADYVNRAYPAAYVPFTFTSNAQQAWKRIKSQRNRNTVGTWTLAGPSPENYPDLLTFSGAPYKASGRITALAVDPNCNVTTCRVWAAAAGGGVWRTTNALSGSGPTWTFVSGSFATNAIGTLTYDAAHNTLYAGTGEPNASADSEAGFGIYKSTDGGNSWTHLAANTSVPQGAGVDCTCIFGFGGFQQAPAYTGPAFDGRSISSIVIDPGNPSIMYVSSARGVRGISSVLSGGVVTLAPGLPPYGLWKSTDGGANFTLLNYQDVCLNPTLPGSAGIVQASFGSSRGVHETALDPGSSSIVYAAPFPANNVCPNNTGGGVWRSTDNGGSWIQMKNARNVTRNDDRASFAVTPITGGFTRMYVGAGNGSASAANIAHLYRTDDAVNATDATFTDLTALQQASSAPNQTIGYCRTQCWYDNVVYSPPGKPEVVYLGGAYDYENYGFRNNGRAFIRSTDAGLTFTDMTWDATTNPTTPGSYASIYPGLPIAPNGQHPDSHGIVELPGTNSAIFGTDGGLMRSNGAFSDISSQCTTYRGLSGTELATCQQLLSAVPSYLYNLNKGLSTLQFQSLSVAADNYKHLQGGTQDNGTMETYGSAVTWPQIIYGDGGQSGFSATNSSLRFNSFTGGAHDVNFQNGDPVKWVIASGPIVASGEGFSPPAQFYVPIVADPNPASAGTIFEGALSVWRTQDWAGNQAYLETNCPEFTTSFANPACGDFVRIGPAGATNLTTSAGDYRGTTRSGGAVAAVARASSDTATLWAATTTGRLFVSKNADALNTNVTFTRIDTLDATSPGRFISGIAVDPADPNHAWITYSSYSSITPATPGHVFSVTFNPGGPSATWTNLDGTNFSDFPATGIAFDSVRNDLYVSNDWGVLRLPNGSNTWAVAGNGLPNVEVAGLTIVPSARKLYAATHGRSAWQLTLP